MSFFSKLSFPTFEDDLFVDFADFGLSIPSASNSASGAFLRPIIKTNHHCCLITSPNLNSNMTCLFLHIKQEKVGIVSVLLTNCTPLLNL